MQAERASQEQIPNQEYAAHTQEPILGLAEPQDQARGQEGPITYAQAFGTAGDLGKQAITPRAAALAASAEAAAFGKTQKGGPAAVMTSAAEKNVDSGAVPLDQEEAATLQQDVTAVHTVVPGAVLDQVYLNDEPLASRTTAVPTTSTEAQATDLITIGEALESAALAASEKPLEPSDARAIQSAEARATGKPQGLGSDGLAAQAQRMAAENVNDGSVIPGLGDLQSGGRPYSLGDALEDASAQLPIDKVVTLEDAAAVAQAEIKASPTGELAPGGVAESLLAAAEMNAKDGE